MRRQNEYKICTTCIMDTSDPGIVFDEQGVCDYCRNFEHVIKPNWSTGSDSFSELMRIAKKIKSSGVDRDFDCIIGLSGGLDSSYTAYVAKEVMGLRPLLFHVDAGWNTDQAVSNIEKLVDGLGVELYTEVINWEEMKDLQLAYFKAQVPDQDSPQDIAFFSALYKFAKKHRVKYVLTGANYSTECCREPEEWGAYAGIDKRSILAIHEKFGSIPLKAFPIVDVFVYRIYYRYILGMQVFRPLNLVPFVKKEAEAFLEEKYGWQAFQHKHHESRFTRFYEDFWLPKKFGFEKRRAHFSSLIMTGQMTRDEAMDRISRPEMSAEFLKTEFQYIAKKLDISVDALQALFEGSNKSVYDYKNNRGLIGLAVKIARLFGTERRFYR